MREEVDNDLIRAVCSKLLNQLCNLMILVSTVDKAPSRVLVARVACFYVVFGNVVVEATVFSSLCVLA